MSLVFIRRKTRTRKERREEEGGVRERHVFSKKEGGTSKHTRRKIRWHERAEERVGREGIKGGEEE
jgi:hypothetical protein